MELRSASRLALIVMALFPALWGLLGFLNDATDFPGTVNNAVRPMIEMNNTYNNPWQTWRAITAPWAAPVGLWMEQRVASLPAAVTLAGYAPPIPINRSLSRPVLAVPSVIEAIFTGPQVAPG